MAYRLFFILGFFSISIGLGLITFFYSLFKSQRIWKEKVGNDPKYRMSRSKNDFIVFYMALGYEARYIDFVYSKTQIFLRAKDLVLLPGDDIIELYERTEDEWIYVLNKWLKELGGDQPFIPNLERRDNKPLDFEFLINAIQSRQVN